MGWTCKHEHNIIQIHNNVLWDWWNSAEYSPHSIWMWGMFRIILSVPQDIVMDLNNGMRISTNHAQKSPRSLLWTLRTVMEHTFFSFIFFCCVGIPRQFGCERQSFVCFFFHIKKSFSKIRTPILEASWGRVLRHVQLGSLNVVGQKEGNWKWREETVT